MKKNFSLKWKLSIICIDETDMKRKNIMAGKNLETRDRIKKAALDLFADYGFSGTSIKQIEKRAGMKSSALIYYYFKDKEDLFWSCITEQNLPNIDMPSNDLDPMDFLIELQNRLLEVCRDEYCYKVFKCMLQMALMEKREYHEETTMIKSIFGESLHAYLKAKVVDESVTEEQLENVISNFYIVFVYRKFISKSISFGITKEERKKNNSLFEINASTLLHELKYNI